MCLVRSGSVLHFDIALEWKFTDNDDFAQKSICNGYGKAKVAMKVPLVVGLSFKAPKHGKTNWDYGVLCICGL